MPTRATACLAALLAPAAHALQPPAQPPTTVRFEQLPPQVQLGLRVAALQSGLPVAPVVVIVPDASSFLEQLARWSPTLRYPILIDDGSPIAREDIARFVRAFAPQRVLLWRAVEPDPPAASRARILDAVARAWDAPDPVADWHALIAHWMNHKHTPFGVVVAHESDASWPAAAALAAGRAQPILWIEPPDRETIYASRPDRVDRFLDQLASELDALKIPWRDLPDALDAVTLCLNTNPRFQARPDNDRDMIALTDQVGRLGSTAEPGPRWGWSGQIFGTHAQSLYRAMCALFLYPAPHSGRAWLFDGYRDQGAFRDYDATTAASLLSNAGWNTRLLDAPRAGRDDWLRETQRGIDADLVLVNTSGNWDFFDLHPGQCRPTDIPTLARPAAVYFVHSWSFQVGPRRDSIAGRWLEHGAYAYVGSVQEPFLQAFVPTPDFVSRLLSPAPWAASARWEVGPFSKPWRVAIFGDPLLTISPRPPAADIPELPDAADLDQSMRDALSRGRFAEALALLATLGRDADAARLAAALLRDRPDALTPPAAHAALMPLFRTGDIETMLRLAARLGPDPASTTIDDPVALDALWHAATPRLPTITDHSLLYLLRRNIRLEQAARDAAVLLPAWQRVFGRGSVQPLIAELRDRVTRPEIRRELDALSPPR